MTNQRRNASDSRASASRGGRGLREFDAQYFAQPGVRLIAGVDEAGRGALAGPVVAAAVIVDRDSCFPGVNDSKQLDEARREALYPLIQAQALGWAVGWASAEEIDRLNILRASILAMERAIGGLQLKPDLILTDALKLEGLGARVEPLVKGDARSQAIAAASVVAKVTRDRWMRALEEEYPGYGFAAHKGYAVEEHMAALRRLSASTIHRLSFRGVEWFDESHRSSRTFQRLIEAFERGEWSAEDVEEVWLGRGYLLPQRELRLLREAIGARDSAARLPERPRGE
jgi:ribonuclease HII